MCHRELAVKAALKIAKANTRPDPIAVTTEVLKRTSIPMLGCHHAFIAAFSLLSALKAAGLQLPHDAFEEVSQRTGAQAISGYCGLTGICGLIPSLGACLSFLVGARCGTKREQKMVMEFNLRLLEKIYLLPAPSCCKAYMWACLEEAVFFFSKSFSLKELSFSKPLCEFYKDHPHGCPGRNCPYFPT